MHKVTELRQERAALVAKISQLQNAASGSMSEATITQIRQLESDCDRLAESAAIAERQERREAELRVIPENRVGGFPNIVSGAGSQYSLVRAVGRLAEGKTVDGIEAEAHQELSRKLPEAARGFVVPLNMATRDFTVTGGSSGSEGGVLVATDKGQIIDALRAAMTLQGLGVTTMTGLTGNLDVPKAAATSASWKPETTAHTETSAAMTQLELRPKRLGCFSEVSRQLLLQSSQSVEQWLRRELGTAIASAWENAAINGTGLSNQPTGILATGSIGNVIGGTHGLIPTWAKIVELESKVADANAAGGSLGYLTNTKVRGKLKTVLRNSSGTDATYIWPDDGRLNGYTTAVSNHVPSNLTKGDAVAVASAIIFANWNDLILAQWGAGLDLIVNPYSRDTEGLVRITASTFVDVGVRRPESFAAMLDALTT